MRSQPIDQQKSENNDESWDGTLAFVTEDISTIFMAASISHGLQIVRSHFKMFENQF